MVERADPKATQVTTNGSTNTVTQDDARRRSGLPEQVKEESATGPDTPDPDRREGRHKNNGDDAASPPKKKRRKVNHACVYCRRSHMTCDLERPCARCIKRDIGHLCHDEPRETAKRTVSQQEIAPAGSKSPQTAIAPAGDSFHAYEQDDGGLSIGTSRGQPGRMDAPQLIQPKPMSPGQMQKQPANPQINDWNFGPQSQFHDMHNLHPNYTFNTSEVTNEYNLLGDFLSTSLLDDGGLYSNDDTQALFNDPLLSTGSLSIYANNMGVFPNQGEGQPALTQQAATGNEISRPSSAFPADTKARDKFYMTAADPAGNDTPEERMNKLMKAKYDAGMLKPFNYVKGYARLNKYMEQNMRASSRQKILRQLDKFRPKFREAMQSLTDIQLVLVEMWFERSLMEYDRVFASMAIPACCWRRTGEIFRGNKEMAELIHVPIEELRDVSFSPKSRSFGRAIY